MSDMADHPSAPAVVPGSRLPAGVVNQPIAGKPIAATKAARKRRLKPALFGLLLGAGLPIGIALVTAFAGGYSYQPLRSVAIAPSIVLRGKSTSAQLAKKLSGFSPKGTYVVVDTMDNRLYLRRDEQTVREAVCSTGTGGLLVDPKSGRKWVFETPLGERKIKEKIKNPIWIKPDWGLVEEGLPANTPWSERIDKIALGDYAMKLGDGYMIHGTPYKRMLGKSVTHGCIRLGDEDLEAVFNAVQIGTPVYLF